MKCTVPVITVKVFFCLDCTPFDGVTEGIFILRESTPVPTLQVNPIFLDALASRRPMIKTD